MKLKHYCEKMYVLLAQREDGTYVTESEFNDRVYLNYLDTTDPLYYSRVSKRYAKYVLRRFDPSSIGYKVDAFTNPNSNNQYEWFCVRELAKAFNKSNYKGCSNWKPYRLNSKHCPVEIDMKLRRKMYKRKVEFDKKEWYEPKYIVK